MKRENVEQPLGSLLDDRDGKGGVENMGGHFRWNVRVQDTQQVRQDSCECRQQTAVNLPKYCGTLCSFCLEISCTVLKLELCR